MTRRRTLGAHIDGYISTLCHTHYLHSIPRQPAAGKVADVVCAAYYAHQVVLASMKPNAFFHHLLHAMQAVVHAFHCSLVVGSGVRRQSRYVDDVGVGVVWNGEVQADMDQVTQQEGIIEDGHAWCIDIAVSSGSGVVKERDYSPMMYKKNVNATYNLKLKAARALLNKVTQDFTVFPFASRDIVAHKLGLNECVKHHLLEPLPVWMESKGEYVARFTSTVYVTPDETHLITPLLQPLPFVHSEYGIVRNSNVGRLMEAAGLGHVVVCCA